MPNKPKALFDLGQSLWYDNIERRLLNDGELAAMIQRGDIYGVTSNPSIFQKAISNSRDYDAEIARLSGEGANADQIFDQLSIADIRATTDLFAPIYEQTMGDDGFVSIEVHPDYANDTETTTKEAARLWEAVDRPNLMVKIPGTRAGLPAIQESIANGININITLIFSRQRYAEVIDTYLSGLEQRAEAGKPVNNIASVASFFVSRIDTKVDNWLDEIIQAEGEHAALAAKLRGKIAIANAKLAYELFQERFSSQRFTALSEKGGQQQRPLWASTSTKNPAYPDTYYVDELIGPGTVNTVPPKTLEAYKDHGRVETTITEDVEAARQALADLEKVGLSLDKATYELEEEGVAAFSNATHSLLDTIEKRRSKLATLEG
jgi:transaldolase